MRKAANGLESKKANYKKKAAIMSYTYTHKGKKVSLPDFKEIPVGLVRKIRKESEADQPWLILETLLDEKQLAVVDTMTIPEFTEFMNGWTQGANLGEF